MGGKFTTRNHHAQRIEKVMRSRADKRAQRQVIKPVQVRVKRPKGG
ncbi:MAG: hypothetical protein H0W83_00405 [Planctomycetes bacterium]|nr:hypothetical protein [Planctomycetota bacterium]